MRLIRYLSVDYQLDLFESAQIKLETPMRNNQVNYKKWPYIFKKVENELRHFFLNYVTSLELDRISQNHSLGLEQEYSQKSQL